VKANKIRLLFICHGNICRSPMAEYIFKHLCRERGVAEMFEVASAAVSTEETGNDIYPPAKRKLREKGIPFEHHAAHQITRAEYDYYDYILCADQANIRRLQWIIGDTGQDPRKYHAVECQDKVSLMMQWIDGQLINGEIVNARMVNISDPWYTGDFEQAYQDIYVSCKAILELLIRSDN
jgi:protein-tyrosine phosphatase